MQKGNGMNQILKSAVYALGTADQLEFLADLGGMNAREKKFLMLLHEGQTDAFIESECGIDHKKYQSFEQMVRLKLTVAVFNCINQAMA